MASEQKVIFRPMKWNKSIFLNWRINDNIVSPMDVYNYSTLFVMG